VLMKRIGEVAARHGAAEPGVEIITASHLRVHPLLLRAFEDRAHEALHGAPHMNCDLCKYRVRLIGREADLGAPQEGHHHHVRAEGDEHDHHVPVRRSRRPGAREPGPDLAFHPWDERLLRRLQLAQ